MLLECPVCRTSNPPGSLACLNCSNPIDHSHQDTQRDTHRDRFDWPPTPDVPFETARATGGPLPPGPLLGQRYEVLKLLGKGGMGSVYKAMDRELDRLVALKVIRSELVENPEILQRFKQELI